MCTRGSHLVGTYIRKFMIYTYTYVSSGMYTHIYMWLSESCRYQGVLTLGWNRRTYILENLHYILTYVHTIYVHVYTYYVAQ